MADRLAINNVRLIDPAGELDAVCGADGGVMIEAGKIAALGPDIFAGGLPAGVGHVDGDGAYLAPGLVDMRVHLREPGAEHKEDIAGVSAAAVIGGVTCVAVLPNTVPAIDDIAIMEFVHRRAHETGLVRMHCFGAATKGAAGEAMSEIGLLTQAGAVGFTDGTLAIADAHIMATILRYSTGFEAIIAQQPNDPSLARDGVMNAGELATRLGLAGIPKAAEAIMLSRDLMLVEMTGARYHASLVSTAESVALIGEAKAKGLDVTCDTAPPYFVLNEEAVGDYRTFAKLFPPLRGEADRLAVIEGLRDGTIDMIVSDHAAQDEESKRLPFAQAEAGGVGLETLLTLTLELVHENGFELARALDLVTARPAARFGLDAGRIDVGAPADLVLFDAQAVVAIHSDGLNSKSKNTPFDGRRARGEVRMTVAGGEIVHRLERVAAA
ncbi:MAG: dihydroorotase [Alphaproteobacteria bacterium]|nr:dihydroorotase [Alphaproteobacteria bacterium]